MSKTDVENKWINVDPKTGYLCIRFRVKGGKKQHYIASGLKDTAKNRTIIRRKRDAIMNDIALEQFDETLERYLFKANRHAQPRTIPEIRAEEKYRLNLLEVWDKFAEIKKGVVEKTTFLAIYQNIRANINKLPTRSLYQSRDIRDWIVRELPHHTAYRNLQYLSMACKWGVDSGLLPDNPFEKLQLPRLKKKSTDDDFRAFKKEHRDLIIAAFEKHPKYSHYAPLVKFLFWTGCRLGEAFALTWGDISEDCTRISISKSRNLYGISKGTKTGKRREFPTEKGSKLQKLLLDIKPLLECDPKQLVFSTPNGKHVTSNTLNKAWNGNRGMSRGKEYGGNGIVKELVSDGTIPYYLKPYATRHTFATWAIAKGITVEKVASYIGDTPETVLRHYLHPNLVESECPDF